MEKSETRELGTPATEPKPGMHQFSSGAKSTVVKPRYDLIPQRGMELVAERFAYGAGRHGERNYRKGQGDEVFIKDRINHLIEHCMAFAETRKRSDLAAIICNGMLLADIVADLVDDREQPEPKGERGLFRKLGEDTGPGRPVAGNEEKMGPAPYCGKGSPHGWSCTRNQAHTGDHVAHFSPGTHVLERWEAK